ncbi:unnamed protein product, partial [marine sediment metagenome]
MWFIHPYHWRSRYDSDNDRLVFEYLHIDDIGGDNWAENVNARIPCTDWGPLKADFTVRGDSDGLPATIHYSDGTDTFIAESDEATETGWAWENTTTVFDASDADTYTRVNLAANRTSPVPKLTATAVYDDTTNIYVQSKIQSVPGNITGWGNAVDISNTGNTDFIYGQSIRSMGVAGSDKKDLMVVWKEGTAIYSRYLDGVAWEDIQTVDVVASTGASHFDFEHGEVAGENEGHVIFVDADGTI